MNFQVMIVRRLDFEPLLALGTNVGSRIIMCAPMNRQAAGHPKSFPTLVARVRFLSGVDSFMFDLLVRSFEPFATVFARIAGSLVASNFRHISTGDVFMSTQMQLQVFVTIEASITYLAKKFRFFVGCSDINCFDSMNSHMHFQTS